MASASVASDVQGNRAQRRSRVRVSGACTNRRPVLVTDAEGGDHRWNLVAGGYVRCCRGCAVRRSWAVRSFVEMGMERLAVGTAVAFVTITEGSNPRGAKEHFEAVSGFLEELMALLGGPRPYVGVREIQERRLERTGVGVWHSHVVIAGWKRLDLRADGPVQDLLRKYGLGSHFNVRVKRVTDPEANGRDVARYLSKSLSSYMTKSYDGGSWQTAMQHLPRGGRLVFSSHAWNRLAGSTLGQVEKTRLAERREAALRAQWGALVDLSGPEHAGHSSVQERSALVALGRDVLSESEWHRLPSPAPPPGPPTLF